MGGADGVRTCTSCGSSWQDGARFCPTDGEPLSEMTIDRYRLVRRVYCGGMSEVFEAEHEHIDRRVALKLLRRTLTRDPEALERLRREARAASSIGHPNIIDVTDFGQTDDGCVYMVMEWLEGETLRELLDEGPLDPVVALDVATQVADGLAAAHGIAVIHRDVKPENCGLVRSNDGSLQVKVLDFGIAKMLRGQVKLTQTGTFVGTPAYVSPEQARGEPVDGRTDVYSMGCMLYELFTGSVPFDHDSPMELVHQQVSMAPEPPSVRAPERGIPAELEMLILQCLEKDRDDRVGSMAQLRDRLRQIRAGKTTVRGIAAGGRARPSSSPPPSVTAAEMDDDDSAETLFFARQEESSAPSEVVQPLAMEAVEEPRRRWRGWMVVGVVAVIAATAGGVVIAAAGGDEVTAARTEHRAPRTEDRTPSADDRGPSAENRAPSTDDREPSTENRQHRADNLGGAAVWSYTAVESKFRVTLTAAPVPLMPREPIELSLQLSDVLPPLSYAMPESRLRADIHFVH